MTTPRLGVIFDTISVKVLWKQWCRWNCDRGVINARKQVFSVVPKVSPWRWNIMCTNAHYVTLGSRCKMASNHRVTDMDKIPVRISKDEAPTQLSVVGPLFISSLLFHLSWDLLVRCVSVFFVLFTLAFTTGWTSLFFPSYPCLFHHM